MSYKAICPREFLRMKPEGTPKDKGLYLNVYPVHICILYCPGPVLAGLVHRMGIWSNPLKNGLIQHTSKINT